MRVKDQVRTLFATKLLWGNMQGPSSVQHLEGGLLSTPKILDLTAPRTWRRPTDPRSSSVPVGRYHSSGLERRLSDGSKSGLFQQNEAQ